jgi:hypothetical protein
MLTEFPKPAEYTIHLNDGRKMVNYFVTDASARRWAEISHLSSQIVRVTRDVDSATVVVFSRNNNSDNSAI